MDPLISVVIPVYNVEKFLPSCIDSVLVQSYHNLQIILIDDGSTDTSGNICDDYALKNKNICVIHKINGGLSDARNAGIRQALGTYITFIDSDDMVHPHMIQYLFDLISLSDSDLSLCQKTSIEEQCFNPTLEERREERHYELSTTALIMHKYFTTSDIPVTAWGKLYKKSLFDNILFPVGKYHEDLFTTYKLLSVSSKICIGFCPYYFYRQRLGSIMLSTFSIKHLDAIDAKIRQANFISKFFPSEKYYAYSEVVYAANQCLFRMRHEKNVRKRYILLCQKIYRKYELYYLFFSRGKFVSKIFSLIAFFNVKIVFFLYRMVVNIR